MEHSNNINDSVKRCLLATVCRFRDKSGSYYRSETLSLEDAPVWMGRDAHAHSTEHSWRGPRERRALPSPPAFKGGERWLGLCLRGWLHLGVKVALELGFVGPEESKDQGRMEGREQQMLKGEKGRYFQRKDLQWIGVCFSRSEIRFEWIQIYCSVHIFTIFLWKSEMYMVGLLAPSRATGQATLVQNFLNPHVLPVLDVHVQCFASVCVRVYNFTIAKS